MAVQSQGMWLDSIWNGINMI